MNVPIRAKTVAGFALLAFSLYLYLFYQSMESLPVGLASVSLFAVGSYLSLREVRLLEPYRKMLPFLAVGVVASLALVTLGLNAYFTNSYYADVLALSSSRLAALLLGLGGVGVHVSNNVLFFPNGAALSAGPACNGAYSTVLFLLLSLIMVADLGRGVSRRRLGVSLALGIIGVYLANALRIAFLASVLYLFGLPTMEVLHQFAGPAFFLGFVSAFWVLSLKWLRPGKITVGSKTP